MGRTSRCALLITVGLTRSQNDAWQWGRGTCSNDCNQEKKGQRAKVYSFHNLYHPSSLSGAGAEV
jgi:hypothetical protein